MKILSKSRFYSLCLGLLSLWCTSCNTPGFYPLYDDSNITKVPGLEGKWKGKSPKTFWTFKVEGDGYLLTYSEGKRRNSADFLAKVLTLDNRYYVDLVLNAQAEEQMNSLFRSKRFNNTLVANGLLPVHQYARLIIKKDSLFIRLLEFPKTDTLPPSHPDYLPYLHGDRDLLIASTKQMQNFIKRNPHVVVPNSTNANSATDYVITRVK